MAGPAASVLLPAALDSEGERRVRTEIERVAERLEGNDFWVDGRPFFLSFGEDYDGEFDDLGEECLADVLGWRPHGAVGFAAMCNSDIDHRLLAQLCIRFAQLLGGVIDFGGELPVGPTLSGATMQIPCASRGRADCEACCSPPAI